MTIALPWRMQTPLGRKGKAISSSLTEREQRVLSELSTRRDGDCLPQSVLEIGSAYGMGSITMALSGARVVSVDHHTHMNSEQPMRENLRVYGVGGQVTMIVADSKATLPSLPDGTFDGAFVDGDHSQEGVLFDAEQCLRLVKPGGWIAFHDYDEASCREVAPALDRLFGANVNDRILIDTLFIVKVPYPKTAPPDTLLTVATLHLPERKLDLQALQIELAFQIGDLPVEHLIEEGPERYGVKMRRSIERAGGRYICWLDDDDLVEPNYVSAIIDAIRSEPTPHVVTFGSYTPGCPPVWLRSGHHDDSGFLDNDRTRGVIKSANHYCAWRKDIASSVPWLPRNYGAEVAWYTGLRHQWHGRIIEHHIPQPLHIYCYNEKKTKCQDRPSINDSLKNGGNRVVIYYREGQCVMGTGWDRDAKDHRVQWPNGFVLTIPASELTYVDEIIYR